MQLRAAVDNRGWCGEAGDAGVIKAGAARAVGVTTMRSPACATRAPAAKLSEKNIDAGARRCRIPPPVNVIYMHPYSLCIRTQSEGEMRGESCGGDRTSGGLTMQHAAFSPSANGAWPTLRRRLSHLTWSHHDAATLITAFTWATAKSCTTQDCRAAGAPDRWKKFLLRSSRADAASGFAPAVIRASIARKWRRVRVHG